MTNRILSVGFLEGRPDPIETVVQMRVQVAHVDASTELRGRFVGPKCQHCTTLEVAYPLRQVSRDGAAMTLYGRLVLPEAGLWDPERPFLYAGDVELWEEGQRADCAVCHHGVRSFRVAGGLRINGRPFTLRGLELDRLEPAEAVERHRAGYNLLVAPVHASRLWDLADQFGFVMLGRLANAADVERARKLAGHVSSLGWLFTEGVVDPGVDLAGMRCALQQGQVRGPDGVLLGQAEP